MQVIYKAENAIDANLLKDLLEHHGIVAFVNGEFLQGGVGEAPTMGLVSVSVADSDVESAISLALKFEKKISEAPVEGETGWELGDRLTDWNS